MYRIHRMGVRWPVGVSTERYVFGIVATGKLLNTLEGHADVVWSVSYSPDGSTLASGSRDRTIRLWDVATGEHLNTLKGLGNICSVAYSPDGGMLASANGNTIHLWDAATGELLNTLDGSADFVSYSPDGRTLASAASRVYSMRFWDVTSYVGGEPTAVAETSWGRIKSHLQGRAAGVLETKETKR